MKCFVSFVCFSCILVFASSAPFFPPPASFSASTSLQLGASNGSASSGGGTGGLTNILSNIDLPGLLTGLNSFVKLVGAFCPPLSQVLDNVIQNVTSTAFRVFGRVILQNGGLGGGSSGGSGSGGGGQRVSVVLPTFPPDEEDEDYDETSDSNKANSASSSSFNSELFSRIGISSSTSEQLTNTETTTLNDIDSGTTLPSVSEEAVTSSAQLNFNIQPQMLSRGDDDISETIPAEKNEATTTNSTKLYTSPINDESNLIAKRHVRVPREAEDEVDQEGAESAPLPSEDAIEDDQDRNKRYLPFGGTVEGHASGGSGNFLFDIIRLVAGSGATEESDEKAHAPAPGGVAEVDIQKSHEGYSTEGIPGPITRLFVIANRGIANLVQDLILRLASTSERLVNFKARLITSLI